MRPSKPPGCRSRPCRSRGHARARKGERGETSLLRGNDRDYDGQVADVAVLLEVLSAREGLQSRLVAVALREAEGLAVKGATPAPPVSEAALRVGPRVSRVCEPSAVLEF